MKKTWIWVAVIVIVLVLGYMGLKKAGLYSGNYGTSSAPTYTSATPVTTPRAGSSIITTQSGAKGNYLTGASGMTLYIFDKDTTGVSNCSGSCAGLWPPYVTASVPATLPTGIATITKSDGSIQFTYKGMPLYYYTGDTLVGDLNGDGVGGIWHLAKP